MLVVSPLPYGLSLPGGLSQVYTPSGFGYHLAIDGLPFLSAASRENPIVRQTAPSRKQQFDNAEEPGEQSLEGWWIRSQQSFHGGAGQLYSDVNANDPDYSPTRFWVSKGIDPWLPGEIKLLKRLDNIEATPVVTITGDNTRAIGITDAGEVLIVDDTTTVSIETSPATGTQSVAMDGTKYYVAGTDGIWERDVTDAPMDPWTKIWNIAGVTTVRIAWVKERLVLASTLGVYELPTGTGPVLPSPNWTPPQGEWTPSGISESNSAIYVAGTSTAANSFVLRFTLDNTGSLPTLASGAVVAQLPQGETTNEIFGYLGRFLAMSTSLGARVAEVLEDGSLNVGPLLFSGEARGWCARGPYLYVSAPNSEFTEDDAGLIRVDLGVQFSDLRFAYATDVYTSGGGGQSYGCALHQDRLLVATDDGLWWESDVEYLDDGYVQSSRIRYGTLEPKIYKLLRARGPTLESDYFVSVIDPDGNETNVVGYVAGQTPGDVDAQIPTIGPADYLSVKFTLSSTVDMLTSAIASGFQLKALPASPRRRILQFPLWCFDLETDRFGVQRGFPGSALLRLLELEAVDEAADTVILQDLDANLSYNVVIESVDFRQTSPPDAPEGFGGIIILTVRTV